MLYQISHSFVGFLFQTSFQRWHFQSLFHSRQAVVFQWRDVALKCCWLTTSNSGGQMKDHYKVWISQVNSMLLLFIPGNQSWPQNFSVQKMKCHSNADAHVVYLPPITALLLLEHLPNSNIVCKSAEQSVQKSSQRYLFNSLGVNSFPSSSSKILINFNRILAELKKKVWVWM